MTRRLILAMAVLVALVAAALAIPMAIVVANDQRAAFISGLEVDTLTTAASMSAEPFVDWQSTAVETALATGARVVVVGPDRTLRADSGETVLDRPFDRPEIVAALNGSLTSDIRMSQTMGEDLRYVAAPIIQNYDVVGAVRLSLPESNVNEEVQETQRWLTLFVITVVITAGLVAWILARSIAAPLRHLAQVAEDLPDDLDLRAEVTEGPPEVRAVAIALNGTAQRLSGILGRTQRVAADASHHLRTPLTGVRLRLEAIEDITDQPDVAREAHAATAEVDRLTYRIEQVLELARSDAGSAPIVEQDVTEIVRERVEAAGVMFGERGIELSSDLADGIVLGAPRGSVSRLADELLANALTYARGHAEVRLSRVPGAIRLSVSDDGPGVPAAERDAIFDRFRRGTTSVPGGSGLGLALVRETVMSMGGSARAEESSAGGLLVTLELPSGAQATQSAH